LGGKIDHGTDIAGLKTLHLERTVFNGFVPNDGRKGRHFDVRRHRAETRGGLIHARQDRIDGLSAALERPYEKAQCR
jgi:hypothetical protein